MSTGWRSDKHPEIISQVFALVSESSHAEKDNTEWPLSTAAASSLVGRERSISKMEQNENI